DTVEKTQTVTSRTPNSDSQVTRNKPERTGKKNKSGANAPSLVSLPTPNSPKKEDMRATAGVDGDFERAWQLYPKRGGNNPKKAAYAKWQGHRRAGVNPTEMIAGVERYAKYIRSIGKEESQ